MKKRVTMQQIADYMGVSKYVVSRALSGKGGVSAETQDRVFKVASQLGYISQPSQILKENNKNIEKLEKQTVLIIMPNIRYQTKESTYWGKIINATTKALEKAGLGIVILTESSSENFSTLINPNAFLGVIGVGYVPTALLIEINNLHLPLVLVDHEDPLVPTDSIFVNNFDATASMTNLLLGIGHKEISFVGKLDWSRSFYDRWLGFKTTLEENNLFINKETNLIEISGEHEEQTVDEVYRWLKSQTTLPSALVCSNDKIAKSSAIAIKKLGHSIPEDISITGFDNTEESYQHNPTITTIDVPKKEIGARAVEMLMRRCRHKDTSFEKVILFSPIIYRDSIKARNHADLKLLQGD